MFDIFKKKIKKEIEEIMISDKEYKEFKEMYDWQRKVEFNKELLRQNIELFFKFQGPNNFFMTDSGPEKISKDKMYEDMWDMMNENGYDDPPRDWVPLDQSLRITADVGKSPFDFFKYIRRRKAMDTVELNFKAKDLFDKFQK